MRKKSSQGKLFIVNLMFGAIPVFSSVVVVVVVVVVVSGGVPRISHCVELVSE